MKKMFSLALALVLLSKAWAQSDTVQAPYLKNPIFPPVKLLLCDSVHYFTKDSLPAKKAVMLMLFNPECSHCRHETEELLQNIDKFRDVEIVMATMMPFEQMKAFREEYQLAKYKNIFVGRDEQYFLFTFYSLRNLPYLAFYNAKKNLISVHEGSMPIEEVLKELKK